MTVSAKPEARSKRAQRILSSTHLYGAGQAVRLKNAVLSSGNVYLITASLPPSGESPQYRIRNEAENFERMALESDLEPVNASATVSADVRVKSFFDLPRPN